MQTVDKNISDLIPAEYNPRHISDGLINLLKRDGIPEGFLKAYKEKIREYKHKYNIPWNELKLVCLGCGDTFYTRKACKSRIPVFCSRECSRLSNAKPKECLNCGKTYINYQNDYFCSMGCVSEYKSDMPLTEKHRMALSKAKKGKPIKYFVENRAVISKKISESLRGKEQPWNRGENHPRYVDGGKAKWARQKEMGRTEYKNWRRSVFARDDYTCQICGERGGNLCADHIKPWALYPMLRYDVNNGRTLCKECHKETGTYGAKTKREEQYELL